MARSNRRSGWWWGKRVDSCNWWRYRRRKLKRNCGVRYEVIDKLTKTALTNWASINEVVRIVATLEIKPTEEMPPSQINSVQPTIHRKGERKVDHQ